MGLSFTFTDLAIMHRFFLQYAIALYQNLKIQSGMCSHDSGFISQ